MCRPVKDSSLWGILNRIRVAYLGPLIRSYRAITECAKMAMEIVEAEQLSIDAPIFNLDLAEITIKRQFSCVEDFDATNPTPRELAKMLRSEVHEISSKMFSLWHGLLHILPACPRSFTDNMQAKWLDRCKIVSGENIVREQLSVENLHTSSDPSISDTHAKIASSLRQCRKHHAIVDPAPIEDEYLFVDSKVSTYCFRGNV